MACIDVKVENMLHKRKSSDVLYLLNKQPLQLIVLVLILSEVCFETCLCASSGNLNNTKKQHSQSHAKFTGNIVLHGHTSHAFDTQSDAGYLLRNQVNQQEPVKSKLFGNVIIAEESQKFGARLRWLSNEEIGITAMQSVYDSHPNEKQSINETRKLLQITMRLDKRFHSYLTALDTNTVTVQNLYMFHVKHPITHAHKCCNMPFSQLRYDPQYDCRISRQTSCDLIPPKVSSLSFNPGRNLTEVWRSNVQVLSTLKWQYFISVSGIHNEYPSTNFKHVDYNCRTIHDTRHRNVYEATVHPHTKYVMIVMDNGNSLSDNQLKIAKAVARHILLTLTTNDHVGVMGLSSDVVYPRDDPCITTMLSPFSDESRYVFTDFFSTLDKQNKITNHSLGFEKAFQMIENTFNSSPNETKEANAVIIYISRGLLSSLADAREVMDIVARYNGRLQHKVSIHTFSVIDVGKPIMYEKTFMQDIAHQNFPKYDVHHRHLAPIRQGKMRAINNTDDLSSAVTDLFIPPYVSSITKPVFSLPYIDIADRALTMSISRTGFYESSLIGVMGIDLHMEDIVQDLTYYNKQDGTSVFMIHTSGLTIMHPALKRPVTKTTEPMHTDIRHFEYYDGFSRIRQKLLSMEFGEARLECSNSSIACPYMKFIWQRLKSAPFIVVLKIPSENPVKINLRNIHLSKVRKQILYHRLDLLPTVDLCRHLKQIASRNHSAVMLSAHCFLQPFEHLSQDETKRMAQVYWTYLTDTTGLISNPGFKDHIRDDVAILAQVDDEWKHRVACSKLNDYIIRRMIATQSGVTMMFPGTLLNRAFDPTKRNWFLLALQFPGRVTLTAPYLDPGGAGFIVTISKTLFEGMHSSPHSPHTDQVVGVMAMDVTLGYLYRMLLENMPTCTKNQTRCFLMDHMGYLIAHPTLTRAYGKSPNEKQHITHQEPLVASDILNHDGFVRKKLCNRFNDRTIQRYYRFNTSLTNVWTNLVHGEHCIRYLVSAVPGTNIFLGIVNQTCEVATAFCPCSTVDQLCMNCGRFEQNECECPCECPLIMDLCTGDIDAPEDRNENCDFKPEENELPIASARFNVHLDQCSRSHCRDKKTKDACYGVVDCEWCHASLYKATTPEFCSSQRVCFGGVVGSRSPYGDEIRIDIKTDTEAPEEANPTAVKTTPVGPVAGGIMGCFVVLAVGVYCYRHHMHRNNRQYVTAIQENGGPRSSHYYNAPEDFEFQEDSGNGHTNIVLASFENPVAAISPYRVNTSYRRPVGADSDHGYSTMTPHDDSEHASSVPCLEPLLIGGDEIKPMVNSPPTLPPPPPSGRRAHSPTLVTTPIGGAYGPIPEQTVLPASSNQTVLIPESNSVVTNVQVHMVDTH